MNFESLVYKRQSCRRFDPYQKPKEEEIAKIMAWAHSAPSACNAQPYRIHIAKGKQAKKVANARSFGMNAFIEDAPVFFILEEQRANFTSTIGSVMKDQDYRSIDIGIIASYICLGATELGLGTCILGMFDEKKIQEICKTKNRIRLLIALGVEKDELRHKKRKKKEDVWVMME